MCQPLKEALRKWGFPDKNVRFLKMCAKPSAAWAHFFSYTLCPVKLNTAQLSNPLACIELSEPRTAISTLYTATCAKIPQGSDEMPPLYMDFLDKIHLCLICQSNLKEWVAFTWANMENCSRYIRFKRKRVQVHFYTVLPRSILWASCHKQPWEVLAESVWPTEGTRDGWEDGESQGVFLPRFYTCPWQGLGSCWVSWVQWPLLHSHTSHWLLQ